jgi:hypothetical protein
MTDSKPTIYGPPHICDRCRRAPATVAVEEGGGYLFCDPCWREIVHEAFVVLAARGDVYRTEGGRWDLTKQGHRLGERVDALLAEGDEAGALALFADDIPAP